MLDFYLIRDGQKKPDYPEKENLKFVGGISYKIFDNLVNKGIIDNRFDYYSDFMWSNQLVKQILSKIKENYNVDFEKLTMVLNEALDNNCGLIAYCD